MICLPNDPPPAFPNEQLVSGAEAITGRMKLPIRSGILTACRAHSPAANVGIFPYQTFDLVVVNGRVWVDCCRP